MHPGPPQTQPALTPWILSQTCAPPLPIMQPPVGPPRTSTANSITSAAASSQAPRPSSSSMLMSTWTIYFPYPNEVQACASNTRTTCFTELTSYSDPTMPPTPPYNNPTASRNYLRVTPRGPQRKICSAGSWILSILSYTSHPPASLRCTASFPYFLRNNAAYPRAAVPAFLEHCAALLLIFPAAPAFFRLQ